MKERENVKDVGKNDDPKAGPISLDISDKESLNGGKRRSGDEVKSESESESVSSEGVAKKGLQNFLPEYLGKNPDKIFT